MLQHKTKPVIFESVFADDYSAFIDCKRALGYKYKPEEWILKRFDSLSVSLNHSENVLTKNLVETYTALKPRLAAIMSQESTQVTLMNISFRRVMAGLFIKTLRTINIVICCGKQGFLTVVVAQVPGCMI